MTHDDISGLIQNKRVLVLVTLLAIIVLTGVLTTTKVMGFYTNLTNAENIVKQAVAQSKSDPNVVKTIIAKDNPLVDKLKKNNLFAPPPPRENPVKTVLGILDDEAYINGKWYKVGAKIGDAKIIAIDTASVTTEWDGKKKVFYPVDAESSSSSSSSQSRSQRSTSRSDATGAKQADMIVIGSEAQTRRSSKTERPSVKNERQISELKRAKIREKMEKAMGR
jgi:Mg-chelatase subunit ChlI